ncbi:MAG: RrF2 family transcriptional regulator [Phycisphaerales bacterium]|nr:RrF2 family transcriptional regulator [Phycisphaerales bacterium]
MKISTRGRYGLRAMLGLARHHADGPMLMESLAKQEGLSIKYLHALLTKLKAAGLVHSVRGAGGGFVLARAPAKIALNEILHALEGSLSLVPCVADKRTCHRASHCTARGLWRELSEKIEDTLAHVSLCDLLDSENRSELRPGTNKSGQRRGQGEHVKAICPGFPI